MNLIGLVKSLLNLQKKIDTKILPSQGLFYKSDFGIRIKRATEDDIEDYMSNYNSDDVGLIIDKVKKVVERNIILSPNYIYDDIKSIDIIFIFLEIVKFTKNKAIKLSYINDGGVEKFVEFGKNTFNYFYIGNDIMKYYDSKNKQFLIDGYKYTMPSIGIENSLTNFLLSKSDTPNSGVYNDYYYDFTYFLSDKNSLSFSEIENLINIFNFDMDDSEMDKIKNILYKFLPIQKYSLIKDGRIIDMNRIDLEKIWWDSIS